MPYPKKYVGHYHNLANYLSMNNFKVYSMEMVAQEVVNRKNYVVDVVAIRSRTIWAFEYKSNADPVQRAIAQVENYVKCFDYVVIVAENLNDLTKHRETFRKLGVGTWHIKGSKITVLDEPIIQEPTNLKKPIDIIYGQRYQNCKSIQDIMMERFQRNMGMKKRRENPFSTALKILKQEQTMLDRFSL